MKATFFFLNQQSLYLYACYSIDTSYIWVRQHSGISTFSKWFKPWKNQTSADINIRLAGKFLWLFFLSMTTEDEIGVFSFSQQIFLIALHASLSRRQPKDMDPLSGYKIPCCWNSSERGSSPRPFAIVILSISSEKCQSPGYSSK